MESQEGGFAACTESLYETEAVELTLTMGGGGQRSRVWLGGAREGDGVEIRGVGMALEVEGRGGLAFTLSPVKATEGFEQRGEDTGIILNAHCGCTIRMNILREQGRE